MGKFNVSYDRNKQRLAIFLLPHYKMIVTNSFLHLLNHQRTLSTLYFGTFDITYRRMWRSLNTKNRGLMQGYWVTRSRYQTNKKEYAKAVSVSVIPVGNPKGVKVFVSSRYGSSTHFTE